MATEIKKPKVVSIVNDIATIKDPNGKDIVLKHCNSMGIGPASLSSFFYKSLAKVIDAGQGSTWPSYNFKSQAVYAEVDGEVISSVVFNFNPEKKQIYIVLSAVNELYRRQGLYKIMQAEVAKIGKSLGAVEVTSFIHASNEITLKASRSCSFEPVYYKMVKNI